MYISIGNIYFEKQFDMKNHFVEKHIHEAIKMI